jgi:flagellar basal body-associated protein FliL
MADAQGTGTGGSFAGKSKRSTGLIIGLVVAIVVALVAAGFAVYYRQQVNDWETAAQDAVTQLEAAGLEIQSATAQTVSEYESQVADLSAQVEDLEKQAEISSSANAETEQQLADTQAELEATQAELADVEAQLLDAQAQLAKVGELVLEDGTYTGPVLAAKDTPYRVILFDAAGLWRVAQVADDATISSGGQSLTLAQFGKLLQSTDPADINLVNGDYKVTVKEGVVVSMRKSTGA